MCSRNLPTPTAHDKVIKQLRLKWRHERGGQRKDRQCIRSGKMALKSLAITTPLTAARSISTEAPERTSTSPFCLTLSQFKLSSVRVSRSISAFHGHVCIRSCSVPTAEWSQMTSQFHQCMCVCAVWNASRTVMRSPSLNAMWVGSCELQ